MYDVTDRGSFQAIKTWVDEIDKNADKHVNKILIGNKCDVEESARAVSRSEGEALSREYSMAFFETSAKKDVGVAEAFASIAKQVVERLSREGGPAPRAGGGAKVDLKPAAQESAAKKGCC